MNANELLEAIAARVYRVTSHEEDWPTVTFEQIGVLMTETYWLGRVANFITENASKITEASNKDLAAIARWGHMESMPAFDEHGHRAEYGEGL